MIPSHLRRKRQRDALASCRFLLVLLGISGWGGTWAQSEPTIADVSTADTVLQIPVSEVVTIRYRIGGASQVLDAEGMRGQGAADLASSLNRLPGVRMETRGQGGSRRIDIRGSGLRSPFGVRNTLILLNGFLMSTADGVGQTEWLDPLLLDRLVVLMGPTGAWLGGSYGGALIGNSLSEFRLGHSGLSAAWSEVRAGSLGRGAAGNGMAFRLAAGAQWQDANQEWTARVTTFSNPGYRSQEANDKVQGELHWRRLSKANAGVLHHVWLSGYSGGWELPGALDSLQALENPTFAPGVNYRAGVERNRWQVAYSRSQTQSGNPSGIYALVHGSDKLNPFGTSAFFRGHKVESEWGGNLRGHWTRSRSGRLGTHSLEFGTTLQADRLIIAEWDSLAFEVPQGLRYDLVTNAFHGWTGLGYKWRSSWGPWGKVSLSAQWGWDVLQRHTNGTARGLDAPWAERYLRAMPLPRLLYQHHFRGGLAWLQWTTGISHPTTFEWVHPERFVPYALEPEWAQCWEVGVRSHEDQPFLWNWTGFHQQIQNAIGPVQSTSDGPLLNNASSYKMQGSEARLSWLRPLPKTVHNSPPLLPAFEVMAAWHSFRFGEDESILDRRGSRLPGIPQWTVGASAMLSYASIRLESHYRHTSTAPLNDANTAWAPAQGRWDVEALWHQALKPGGSLIWRISVLNLLEAPGSSWWTVNANQGRFYNPMPPRTWQMGLRWEWQNKVQLAPTTYPSML